MAPGVVIAEVARRHDVHPNLLHAWRRQAGTGASPSESDSSRFVPVTIGPGGGVAGAPAGGVSGSAMIEVILGNGVVLRVPEGAAAGRAAQLAAALSELGR